VKQGTLQLGGILDDLGAVADEGEFVQLMNQAVAMGVVQAFTMRARLPRIREISAQGFRLFEGRRRIPPRVAGTV